MLTVTKRFSFEACHSLPHYDGACHNLHGHSYKLDVTVGGNIMKSGAKEGMIIDFKDLKKIVESVVGVYDHSNLNDHFENPTAEIMARQIGSDLLPLLNQKNCHLVSVKLWETETSYAEYSPFNDFIMDRLMKKYGDNPTEMLTLQSAT